MAGTPFPDQQRPMAQPPRYGSAAQAVALDASRPYGQESTWDAPQALPQERSIGICILLFIVTLTIYQWFWIYNVHKELPKRRGIDHSPGMALALTLGPAIASILINFWLYATFASVSWKAIDDPPMGVKITNIIVGIATTAVAFFVYPRLSDRINAVARERLGAPTSPVSRGVVIWWIICMLLINIPLIGILAAIAGFILMIIWWVNVQQTLNRIAVAAQLEPR